VQGWLGCGLPVLMFERVHSHLGGTLIEWGSPTQIYITLVPYKCKLSEKLCVVEVWNVTLDPTHLSKPLSSSLCPRPSK